MSTYPLRTAAPTPKPTTGIEKLQSNIATILNEMAEAGELAKASGTKVTESHDRMTSIENGIRHLADYMKEVEEVFAQLSRQSSEIGAIVVKIQNIAKQTNLLALNASIEAARAGEHGRGFAVVADEVRNLALRANESSEDIDSIATNLNQTSREAGTGMKKISLSCQDCLIDASTALEAMESIKAGAVARMDVVRGINNRLQQQKQLAEELGAHGSESSEICLR